MLKFICSNFLSFGKKFESNNMATNNRSSDLKNHFFKRDSRKIETLKGATIYGLNALGKSNFLETIKYSSLSTYQNKFLRETQKSTRFEYRKRMVYQERY